MSKLTGDQESIYSFWNDIPAVLDRDHEIMDKVASVNVREIIIKLMAKGINDDLFGYGKKRRRYALTPKELLELVNKELNKTVKLSNIYFHLDKLKEFDLIEVISEIHEGKYKIRYFGRKAKLFIFTGNTDKNDYLNLDTKYKFYKKLLSELNPDQDTNEMLQVLKKYLNNEINVKNKTINWFSENHQVLSKFDFDTQELYFFITLIYSKSEKNDELANIKRLFRL